MRRLIVAVLFLPVLAFGTDVKPVSGSYASLDYYLGVYSSSDGRDAVSHHDFLDFVAKLDSKRTSFRDDRAFINHVFVKVHQKFLKNFTPYASFGELLETGNYNCLTGTATYGLLLEHFGIDYKIIETNYHIFLLAGTGKETVLLEATDPINGFTDSPVEIEKRIALYKQNTIQATASNANYYHYSFDLYNEVKLDQLLGLMHYNLAIVNYNNQQFSHAISHLDKALELYDSPRIEEFSRVIMLSVVESSLDAPVKEFYVKRIQSIRKKRVMLMASAKAN